MDLHSSLLLASLCSLSSWSACSVSQTPDVSVMEGEAASISCCWEVTFEGMTLTWRKNSTHLESKRYGLVTNECSDLTFPRITRDDSGTYFCRLTVEIPEYKQLEGNGTVITVMTRDNTDNNKTGDRHPGPSMTSPLKSVIISLALVTPLLLITLVCFCSLRWKPVQAARVIYEVPHIHSEEADMDKRSTSSSRGSSQWCQVPVYESFDYFERVQTNESG